MMKRPDEYSNGQLALRRSPKQLRSRLLFDKIIATARMLFERDGYAFVTTNKIAEEAHISIGSLYQYFNNCESIAMAVYELACAKAALTMKQQTMQSLGRPLEESTPKHIGQLFNIFERDRYVLLLLMREAPELRQSSRAVALDSISNHTARLFLEQHFIDVDEATIARKAYFVNKCVLGLIGWYLDERPEFISKEAAIHEISEMVHQYVQTLSKHSRPTRYHRH